MLTLIRLAVAQADLNSLFATFVRYIITGCKSFRSATVCTDRGVSYRNYLGTCIFVWEPMVNTAHFGGFKLVTNLEETKEAKCKWFRAQGDMLTVSDEMTN